MKAGRYIGWHRRKEPRIVHREDYVLGWIGMGAMMFAVGGVIWLLRQAYRYFFGS